MNAPISILYFAWLRERVGVSAESLELPANAGTVADLVALLAARGGGYAAAFANRNTIRCAINQEFAEPSAAIRPGDEVAFFPPVTGG
jgi:molybdopterin synthase sulfur carrier subunit